MGLRDDRPVLLVEVLVPLSDRHPAALAITVLVHAHVEAVNRVYLPDRDAGRVPRTGLAVLAGLVAPIEEELTGHPNGPALDGHVPELGPVPKGRPIVWGHLGDDPVAQRRPGCFHQVDVDVDFVDGGRAAVAGLGTATFEGDDSHTG